jgi:hypothetical protein
MNKYLLGAAIALSLFAAPAHAAVVGSLGINPTSAQGAFSTNDSAATQLPTGLFSQDWTFDLVGGPKFVTIASVLNVFPAGVGSPDYIKDFTGAVYKIVGAIGGADDIAVISPVAATLGAGGILQSLFGTAVLDAGSYYAQFTGDAGVTAGYGGNLAVTVSAVPIPAALPLFGTALGGLFLLKHKKGRARRGEAASA